MGNQKTHQMWGNERRSWLLKYLGQYRQNKKEEEEGKEEEEKEEEVCVCVCVGVENEKDANQPANKWKETVL